MSKLTTKEHAMNAAATDSTFTDLEGDFDAECAAASAQKASDYFTAQLNAPIREGSFQRRNASTTPAPMVPCPRCGGDGVWHGYGDATSGRRICLKCAGTGKVRGLKMDPASVKARAKAAERRESKKAAKAAELRQTAESWRESHPAESAWLASAAQRGSTFAQSLQQSLAQYGSLTENQLAAVQRCIAKDGEREAARKAVEESAQSVAGEGFDKLLRAFESAVAAGLKYPSMTVGELVFKPAKAASANAGHIYVTIGKGFGAPYLGKITPAGKLLPSRECSTAQAELIAKVGADPLGEAKLHGQRTGRCSCCGRELTDHASIEAGIGPVCAENFGL